MAAWKTMARILGFGPEYGGFELLETESGIPASAQGKKAENQGETGDKPASGGPGPLPQPMAGRQGPMGQVYGPVGLPETDAEKTASLKASLQIIRRDFRGISTGIWWCAPFCLAGKWRLLLYL